MGLRKVAVSIALGLIADAPLHVEDGHVGIRHCGAAGVGDRADDVSGNGLAKREPHLGEAARQQAQQEDGRRSLWLGNHDRLLNWKSDPDALSNDTRDDESGNQSYVYMPTRLCNRSSPITRIC